MTPPPPSLRALVGQLRELHAAWSHPDCGGEYIRLMCECLGNVAPYYRWIITPSPDYYWVACLDTGAPYVFGREFIPGDGAPFDAVAAARRLLAAARDGGAR